MKSSIFAALAILSTLLLIPAYTRADLAGEVDQITADKLLDRATVGIDIVRLGNSNGDVTPVYRHNASTPLVPASNLKVITTSAALEELGAGFKFRTLLLGHNGDLVLIGDGDPTLGDAEMLKNMGGMSIPFSNHGRRDWFKSSFGRRET